MLAPQPHFKPAAEPESSAHTTVACLLPANDLRVVRPSLASPRPSVAALLMPMLFGGRVLRPSLPSNITAALNIYLRTRALV